MSFYNAIGLVLSCKSNADWQKACDKIKDAYGGDYPEWWYREIVQSGLFYDITSKFED